MTDLNPIDDTTDDYRRFEAKLVAHDRDATHAVTADIGDTAARKLVTELIDDGVVTPVPGQRVFVHEPSGTAFDSSTQLAVFHRGWTAARDADEVGE
ncbi:hypothetical protein [Natronorubrum thiooxidans]|uniref:DUF8069 domain-containing protein n=1 Tax=Natronorubrum thiooxidans TaxID=308853 RepID=A0A1N7HA45_9EURY|nr:hypothetical protein [Natronorubrum thiooxidans]SIS21528.1 hypothetical protein SAMN05421752_1372 [Natronorubrum thiooxidans]